VKIKWLGHASFLITSDAGIKIITDPYVASYVAAGGPSYSEIKESADIVTVSHDHSDHNNVAAVRGNPEVVKGTAKVKGIEFKGIPTYHDDAGGNKRGDNTILCFEVDGVSVCHLGDLGHQLSDKQVAELGAVDILLIPVGGFYTIDAKMATKVCNQLKPKVVIPMHYKTDKCGFPIAGVDEFLQGKAGVSRLDASEVEFKRGELPVASTQIIVLKSAL
jgi:L-ascorbate metabolism protein UlaG (beta-lactamase superfamily)